MNEFLEIGPAGSIAKQRVVAIGRYASAPLQRAARQARKEGRLIDLTYGKACRWVFFLDSGHIVLGTHDFSLEESEVEG